MSGISREDLPEDMELCPECRGRGLNFNREDLSLDTCVSCNGSGIRSKIDQELQAFLSSRRER